MIKYISFQFELERSFFLKKTLDILCGLWYYNYRKGKENPEHQKG